jgi:excinuclease ABC subunit B
MPDFKVISPFVPAGDQPEAITQLVDGLATGDRFQTLRGITGSGKTATIAWTIEAAQRPTLIIEPNKSLAAQLASELRELFGENRVEFFVSYYDYYQPEAYLPTTDTYIEKDSSINDEIDRLRHSATASLLTRRDVIVVASVSCIYGLGSPDEYRQRILEFKVGESYDQRALLGRLVDLGYDRNDVNLVRGTFRVRGDTLEVHPAYEESAIRIELFGDTIERISPFDVTTGRAGPQQDNLVVFGTTHYGASSETVTRAVGTIKTELDGRLAEFKRDGKLLEAQRLAMRTEHDLEMLAEIGVCSGVENYSRHLDGRGPGDTPYTLLDFFDDDFLVVLDESHVTIPQLHGQYAGDRSRKTMLIEHGFRLPSALDNRPLEFAEFERKVGQAIFVSATPGPYEKQHSSAMVDQIIRPTGLVDPPVVIRPSLNQIDDLMVRIKETTTAGMRSLVTTLTKKMSEDLSAFLADAGMKVRYLHSDISTIERIELLRDLRVGEYDVLVGINLLREGLDLPEVALVAILDADKEGFLRSESSLIQTMGRAARNSEGRVVLYADRITDSMRVAIDTTQRRRKVQIAYNEEHGIDPKTISKSVTDILASLRGGGDQAGKSRAEVRKGATKARVRRIPSADESVEELVSRIDAEMRKAAKELRFEEAALLRDELTELRAEFGSDLVVAV